MRDGSSWQQGPPGHPGGRDQSMGTRLTFHLGLFLALSASCTTALVLGQTWPQSYIPVQGAGFLAQNGASWVDAHGPTVPSFDYRPFQEQGRDGGPTSMAPGAGDMTQVAGDVGASNWLLALTPQRMATATPAVTSEPAVLPGAVATPTPSNGTAQEAVSDEGTGPQGEVVEALSSQAVAPTRGSGRRRPAEYTVQPGDTLFSIARRQGVSVGSLMESNDLGEADILRPGQRLLIPPVEGVVHRVLPGETLSGIAAAYGVEYSLVAEYNRISADQVLAAGDLLVIPGGRRATIPPTPSPVPPTATTRPSPTPTAVPTMRPSPVPSTPTPVRPAPLPSPSPGPNRQGLLTWPLMGTISTYFGEGGHRGIDIEAGFGAAVRAAADGRVVVASQAASDFGWYIVLDHGNGLQTLYAHLSSFAVKAGDGVKKGQVVGSVGNTGRSTGPHLHFEVRVNGAPVDPLKYLP